MRPAANNPCNPIIQVIRDSEPYTLPACRFRAQLRVEMSHDLRDSVTRGEMYELLAVAGADILRVFPLLAAEPGEQRNDVGMPDVCIVFGERIRRLGARPDQL